MKALTRKFQTVLLTGTLLGSPALGYRYKSSIEKKSDNQNALATHPLLHTGGNPRNSEALKAAFEAGQDQALCLLFRAGASPDRLKSRLADDVEIYEMRQYEAKITSLVVFSPDHLKQLKEQLKENQAHVDRIYKECRAP